MCLSYTIKSSKLGERLNKYKEKLRLELVNHLNTEY